MRVLYRPTGQLGEIPDDRFDPSLFQALDKPQQAIQQPQQGLASQAGNFLINTLLGGTKKAFETAYEQKEKPISLQEIGVSSLGPLGQLLLGSERQKAAARGGAELASYAVPFGKGTNILSKVLLPGAATGALQELGKETATPQSVLGGAALGAGGAGILHKILSGAGGLFGGKSQAIEQVGKDISASVRKIRTKPGIYGAEIEKGINNTLDKFGFKGSPQQQYENLAPAMGKLEGQIKDFIQRNPSISVAKEDIKKSFISNLQSALRSKEMTEGQAIKEVDGYLRDLLKASGGTGKFTSISLEKLRNLKKLVNNDYGPVQRLIETNGTLSARQKVIAEAWTSLDEAIKNVAPEVKNLLKHESNLYRAAPSLSAARFNAPTQRLFGTSIPGAVTQTATDLAGRGVQGIGKTGEMLGQGARNPLMELLAGQMGARLPLNIGQNVQNENYTPDYQGIQNQSPGDLNQIAPPPESISQTDMAITPEILTMGRLTLSEKEYKKLKDIYDIQKEPTTKPTEKQKQFAGAAEGAQYALDLLNKGKVKTGPLAGRIENLKSSLIGTGKEQQDYMSTIALARSSLLNAFLGGNIPPAEYARIQAAIPTDTDPLPTAKRKLETFVREMKRFSSGEVQAPTVSIPQQL